MNTANCSFTGCDVELPYRSSRQWFSISLFPLRHRYGYEIIEVVAILPLHYPSANPSRVFIDFPRERYFDSLDIGSPAFPPSRAIYAALHNASHASALRYRVTMRVNRGWEGGREGGGGPAGRLHREGCSRVRVLVKQIRGRPDFVRFPS